MQFRKGDVVSVRGTVKYDIDEGEDRLFVRVDGGTEDLWVKAASVTMVRQSFEVDDWVMWGEGFLTGECGQIVGISGEHAWIDMGSGNYATRHFGAIQRGPEHPSAEVQEPRTAAGSLD